MPNLVFLHGPAASGKLTIAKELAELTSYKLFHNHLTVDMLLSLFPFASPNFIKHRHHIWHDLLVDSITEGSDIIFTYCPEITVSPSFISELKGSVEANGGNILFVQIDCPLDVLVSRMGSESRKQHHKLSSGEDYVKYKADGCFATAPIPSTLVVDSSTMPAKDAALHIARSLKLIE